LYNNFYKISIIFTTFMTNRIDFEQK